MAFHQLVLKELTLCQSISYSDPVRRKAHGVETRKHSRRVCWSTERQGSIDLLVIANSSLKVLHE